MLFVWGKWKFIFSLLILSTIVIHSQPIYAESDSRKKEATFCTVSQNKVEKAPSTTVQKVDVKEFSGKVISAKSPHILPSKETSKPSSLNPDLLFQLINDYRKSIGLSEFQKDEKLCALARERGPELPGEVASGAFHQGLYARNLPYWVTENMKYGTDEKGALDWWLTSYIHKKAVEGNFTYSCGECWGNACIELFTSYIPR